MSEPAPYEFSGPLTVCVDFNNPHAYLAKDLVYALEDDLGVEAAWVPYLVPALKPPTQPQASDDRGTRHRWHRARYAERDIQRYAGVRGLVIRDIYRQVDSSVSAMALLWLRRENASVRRGAIDGLFAGHWEGRLNIEDVAAVTALLDGAGVDLGGWEEYCAGDGRAELQKLLAGLRAAGIFTVPAFVVSEAGNTVEIFYGRAHLPMVRWLLDGKIGPVPI